MTEGLAYGTREGRWVISAAVLGSGVAFLDGTVVNAALPAIARDLDDCGCAYITPHDRELGQRSVEWTLAHTNETSKGFMRELPFDLRFEVGETAVHLVHGSPRKVNEYLFEDKPASLYERLAAAEDAPGAAARGVEWAKRLAELAGRDHRHLHRAGRW